MRDPVRTVEWLMGNRLLLPIYAPTLLLSIWFGMLEPVLPLYAGNFGISYGLIGLMLAAREFGTLVADLPAGALQQRLGRKPTMVAGLGTAVLGMGALAFVATFWAAMGLLLVTGFGMALYNISRHLYLTEMIARHERGKAIATFGGVHRVGVFVGPALGGLIAEAYGLRAPFLLCVLFGGLALLLVIRFIPRADGVPQTAVSHPPHQIWRTIRDYAHLLTAAGMGQIFAQTIRAGRRVIIPLYAADVLGLDVQAIGWVVSLAAAVDMSLFFVAGWLMDRYGRKFAIVPSFLIQGVGMALVPFTGGFGSLLAATCVIGLGNGLGSGTMMTLGSDLAPDSDRSGFLGAWRFIGDSGSAVGPAVVGGVAQLFVLQTAVFVIAGAGLLASFVFARFVPETRMGSDSH